MYWTQAPLGLRGVRGADWAAKFPLRRGRLATAPPYMVAEKYGFRVERLPSNPFVQDQLLGDATRYQPG